MNRIFSMENLQMCFSFVVFEFRHTVSLTLSYVTGTLTILTKNL